MKAIQICLSNRIIIEGIAGDPKKYISVLACLKRKISLVQLTETHSRALFMSTMTAMKRLK